MPRFMGALTGNHLPAEAVMIGEATAVRSAKRMPVRLTARMTLKSHDEGTQVAWVRDLSSAGVFFYSNFGPAIGEEVAFVLQLPSGMNRTTIHCSGKIARVEQTVPGAAFGVAVQFDASVVVPVAPFGNPFKSVPLSD